MRLLLILLMLLPSPALAGVEVVASIAPVHSLVARVMEGAGAPRLLMPPGAEPHDYALRPSDAAALSGAALVVRIGPELEAWMDRPLSSLASGATVLDLAALPGVTRLKAREGAAFEHDPPEDHAEGGDLDPHLWLDPENARAWLPAIAEALARADPANAALYRDNAKAGAADLAALSGILAERLAPLQGRPFIVLHDAFHYFERRFGIEAKGAISVSSDRAPGPARLAEIRARLVETGAKCLFAEPQFSTKLADAVAEGTEARIVKLDPLGAGLEPSPELYPQVLTGIADGLASCL